jgi:hypothetical protein
MSTAPPFILRWSNLEILFALLHRSSPFIGGLRCQAIQTEHGPYITERTQKAVYILGVYGFSYLGVFVHGLSVNPEGRFSVRPELGVFGELMKLPSRLLRQNKLTKSQLKSTIVN